MAVNALVMGAAGVAELHLVPDLPEEWHAAAADGTSDVRTFPVDGSIVVGRSVRHGGGSIHGGYFLLAGPALRLSNAEGAELVLADLGITFARNGSALVTFDAQHGSGTGRPGFVLDVFSVEATQERELTLEGTLLLERTFAQFLRLDTRAGHSVGYLRLVLSGLTQADSATASEETAGHNYIDQSPHLSAGDVIGPDVFTLSIGRTDGGDFITYGTTGGRTGYAFRTTSCNIGDQEAEWFANTNRHPVIAQNMYRIDQDGDFEQIGMSWLKHAFCAADSAVCQEGGTGNNNCSMMTIGIADVYSANLNGWQQYLGPRSEVNAASGYYPYPYILHWNEVGNAVFKRLQIDPNDLNPNFNPNAVFIGESHYVTTDEAAQYPESPTQYNNAAWRQVVLGPYSDGWSLSFTGPSHPFESAIEAWPQFAGGVRLETVMVTNETDGAPDGKVMVGSRAMSNGDGTWHYSYAVYNYNSDRSIRGFAISLPEGGAALQNVGFHDVEYHSGEPYSGDDWQATVSDTVCNWETDSYDENVNANAIRWGTTYSFEFDSDLPPYGSSAALDLFKPGTPMSLSVPVDAPSSDCDGNDVADQAQIDGNAGLDVNDNGTLDACETISATVTALSARQLELSFLGPSDPFAVIIYGDETDPYVDCVFGFLQADGSLGSFPVFQSALQWGVSVVVEDEAIIPGRSYRFTMDTPELPDLFATSQDWADVNTDGNVNLQDAFHIVLGLLNAPQGNIPLERLDLDPPCDGGNGTLNVADLQQVVIRWQGIRWTAICPTPCNP